MYIHSFLNIYSFLKFQKHPICGIPQTSSSQNINELLEINLLGHLFLVKLRAEDLEHN